MKYKCRDYSEGTGGELQNKKIILMEKEKLLNKDWMDRIFSCDVDFMPETIYLCFLTHEGLTQYGLVISYGVIDLGQHWHR